MVFVYSYTANWSKTILARSRNSSWRQRVDTRSSSSWSRIERNCLVQSSQPEKTILRKLIAKHAQFTTVASYLVLQARSNLQNTRLPHSAWPNDPRQANQEGAEEADGETWLLLCVTRRQTQCCTQCRDPKHTTRDIETHTQHKADDIPWLYTTTVRRPQSILPQYVAKSNRHDECLHLWCSW